ncbi:MAG: hypothetical protein CK424_00135 [Legionella sp.]|nr:MAG: hypothetical protein CK424_00135 [Legionella sp.]
MNKSAQLKIIALLITGCGVLSAPITYADTSMMPADQTTQTSSINDQKLRAVLLGSLAPYANKINIVVTNGVVYLSGQLDSNTDYEKVVTMAQSTNGIVDVNADHLTIKDSQNSLADTYITSKVKGALIQSEILGKDISAWSVHVETKNGEVYLSGTVKSQAEKEHIVATAQSIKGVTKVIDQVDIVPAE